jgi:hypothetical protein
MRHLLETPGEFIEMTVERIIAKAALGKNSGFPVGVRSEKGTYWFWIGMHADHDHLLGQL